MYYNEQHPVKKKNTLKSTFLDYCSITLQEINKYLFCENTFLAQTICIITDKLESIICYKRLEIISIAFNPHSTILFEIGSLFGTNIGPTIKCTVLTKLAKFIPTNFS